MGTVTISNTGGNRTVGQTLSNIPCSGYFHHQDS